MYIGNEHYSVESIPAEPDFKYQAPEPAMLPEIPAGPLIDVPLGRIFGTRSGDKGGNANLGVWARSAEAFVFLNGFLSVETLKTLLPDLNEFEIERHELPNFSALNFVIKGFLGEGPAASFKMDPQAKTLGEYLRVKMIAVPESVIED